MRRGVAPPSPPPQAEWCAGAADPADWTLVLRGDWRAAATLPPPPGGAAVLAGMRGLAFDCGGLTGADAGLAPLLHARLADAVRGGLRLRLDGLPEATRSVLQLALLHSGEAAPPAPPLPGAVERLGLQLAEAARQARLTVAFVGEVLLALGRLARGRSAMRLGDLARQLDVTGPLSLPIVALTCALVGLMLAYMGGAQLDRIGAQGFIADIVTVGMVREMGGLMTGVILSGRIGAAFAAQLATMQSGEEIDALRALGVDPVEHLVLPRLLALVAVAPLLIAYAALIGVLAGLPAAAFVYGLPPAEYLQRSAEALTWTHVWIGLFKGALYAALVALAGCREGLFAGRDAQAVGEATTRGVVKALVWIVVAACATTVVFQSLGF